MMIFNMLDLNLGLKIGSFCNMASDVNNHLIFIIVHWKAKK